ncbi:MAG: VOC family protein [Myxococcota bacterium]
MKLGAFSISLAVQNLEASRAFYAKLGFQETGGDAENNWLIMANGETIIGLFQGIIEANTLTFNPGLNNRQEKLDTFTDVRTIQTHLKAQGLDLKEEVAEDNTEGAAHLVLMDPDGNPILIDQFF